MQILTLPRSYNGQGRWGGQNLVSFEAAALGNLQPSNAEEVVSRARAHAPVARLPPPLPLSLPLPRTLQVVLTCIVAALVAATIS